MAPWAGIEVGWMRWDEIGCKYASLPYWEYMGLVLGGCILH